MRLLSILMIALLSACSSSVKVSNSRSAVIHAGGIKPAQTLADTECGKHKRIAKFVQEKPEFVYTFDCVE
jgi:hypothetical protein